VNFVQVDAQQLNYLTAELASIAKMPILFVFSFAFLFYFLGLSFFAGIGVFLIAFLLNMFLGKVDATLYQKLMERKDEKMNLLTEMLNNIKMLKLYAWTSFFEKKLNERRESELHILRRCFAIGVTMITNLYFFPSILGAVCFAVYIGSGNELSMATTFTVLTFLDIL